MSIKRLRRFYKSKKDVVEKRLQSFKSLSEVEQQKEFVFCMLTPQSNAQRCWEAVEQIFKTKDFTEDRIKEILKTKTRFHNNKTRYVLENIKMWNKIKAKLNNEDVMCSRNWLADNIKGYGLKEASHFLRNIGKSDNKIAILDRHILRNLQLHSAVKDAKIGSKRDYLEKEQIYLEFAKKSGIKPDSLDLLFWSMENGEIFK